MKVSLNGSESFFVAELTLKSLSIRYPTPAAVDEVLGYPMDLVI